MNQESIKRGILAGIIGRYTAEIADDPERSIRKLVDLAERTSDGPTQKICYQMMQKMAANQSSPYYEMIHRLVTHVSPATIREFGINLGHNAWTFGSGHMRMLTENHGLAIPWTVLIDRTDRPGRIPFAEIRDLVKRGREMEIYAWLLIAGDSAGEWDDWAELFRACKDSVFGLCIDPGVMPAEILEEAAEIPNLMILVNTDGGDWQEFAEKLSEKHCLFSACKTVSSEETAGEVLNGSWFEELVPYHPLIAFTVISDDCPQETAEKVSRYMWNTRLEQTYPVLPSDLISDFLIISRLVSHKEVLYRIERDGSVSEGEGFRFRPGNWRCESLFKPAGTGD